MLATTQNLERKLSKLGGEAIDATRLFFEYSFDVMGAVVSRFRVLSLRSWILSADLEILNRNLQATIYLF